MCIILCRTKNCENRLRWKCNLSGSSNKYSKQNTANRAVHTNGVLIRIRRAVPADLIVFSIRWATNYVRLQLLCYYYSLKIYKNSYNDIEKLKICFSIVNNAFQRTFILHFIQHQMRIIYLTSELATMAFRQSHCRNRFSFEVLCVNWNN